MPGLPQEVYPELQQVLGGCLQVSGYDLEGLQGDTIRDHVAQLNRFSPALLRKLRFRGLKSIEIGKGSVADFPGYEHLVGVEAPGHRSGITYADIAGGYDARAKRLLLGTQGLNLAGLVAHELGHAMGDLLGIYETPVLKSGYERNARAGNLESYFLDGGNPSRRGLEEFFADLVKDAILQGRATSLYGQDVQAFIQSLTRREVW